MPGKDSSEDIDKVKKFILQHFSNTSMAEGSWENFQRTLIKTNQTQEGQKNIIEALVEGFNLDEEMKKHIKSIKQQKSPLKYFIRYCLGQKLTSEAKKKEALANIEGKERAKIFIDCWILEQAKEFGDLDTKQAELDEKIKDLEKLKGILQSTEEVRNNTLLLEQYAKSLLDQYKGDQLEQVHINRLSLEIPNKIKEHEESIKQIKTAKKKLLGLDNKELRQHIENKLLSSLSGEERAQAQEFIRNYREKEEGKQKTQQNPLKTKVKKVLGVSNTLKYLFRLLDDMGLTKSSSLNDASKSLQMFMGRRGEKPVILHMPTEKTPQENRLEVQMNTILNKFSLKSITVGKEKTADETRWRTELSKLLRKKLIARVYSDRESLSHLQFFLEMLETDSEYKAYKEKITNDTEFDALTKKLEKLSVEQLKKDIIKKRCGEIFNKTDADNIEDFAMDYLSEESSVDIDNFFSDLKKKATKGDPSSKRELTIRDFLTQLDDNLFMGYDLFKTDHLPQALIAHYCEMDGDFLKGYTELLELLELRKQLSRTTAATDQPVSLEDFLSSEESPPFIKSEEALEKDRDEIDPDVQRWYGAAQLKEVQKKLDNNLLYEELFPILKNDIFERNLDIYAGVTAALRTVLNTALTKTDPSQMYLTFLSDVGPYDDSVYRKTLLDDKLNTLSLSNEEKIIISSGACGPFVDYLLFPPIEQTDLEQLENTVLGQDFIETCKEMLGKIFGIEDKSIREKSINSIFEKVRTLLIKGGGDNDILQDLKDILSHFIKNPTPLGNRTDSDPQEAVIAIESAGQNSEQRNFPTAFLKCFLEKEDFFTGYLVGEKKKFASQLEFFSKFHEHCSALEQLKDRGNENVNDENNDDDMLYAIGTFIAEHSPKTLTDGEFWKNLKNQIPEKEWKFSDGFVDKIQGFLKTSTHKSKTSRIGFYFMLFLHWVKEKADKKKKWDAGIEIETGTRSTQVSPEPSTSQGSDPEDSVSASSIDDTLLDAESSDSEQSSDRITIEASKEEIKQAKKQAKKLLKQSMTRGESFSQKLSVEQRRLAILAEICFLTGKMPLLMDHLLTGKSAQALTALAKNMREQVGDNLKDKNETRVQALFTEYDDFFPNLTQTVAEKKNAFLSYSSPSPKPPKGKVSPRRGAGA